MKTFLICLCFAATLVNGYNSWTPLYLRKCNTTHVNPHDVFSIPSNTTDATIHIVADGKCVDIIWYGVTPGSVVQDFDCHPTDTDPTHQNQAWSFEGSKIVAKMSKLCLGSAASGTPKAGSPIVIDVCTTSSSDFTVQSVGTNEACIVHTSTGLCVGVGEPTNKTNYPWRESMRSTCWTNVSCNRAMVVSHGGDWDLTANPYDSLPAFKKAYADGVEAVKGDFRVSSDNVGVIMHSSPIQFYESLNCVGQYPEKMTAAQCTACKMALTNWTFMSLPELLAWSDEKVITMLCVKRSQDIPRAISSIIELNATDRVFLEIVVGDLLKYVIDAKPPGWDQVYYVAEGGSAADITTVLSEAFTPLLPMAFMFEYDPTFPKWGINLTLTVQQLHSRGMKTFTATTELLPSVQEHVGLFNEGIDIVYTYDATNAVAAREIVNKARGVSPP